MPSTQTNPAEYYASAAGGHQLFQANTGTVSVPLGGAWITTVVNPVSSAKNAYIYYYSLNTTKNATFSTFIGSTVSGGTLAPTLNAGGGANTAVLQVSTAITTPITSTGGVNANTYYIAAFSKFDQTINGAIFLPPGATLSVFVQPAEGNCTASAFNIWWEA